MFIKSFSSLLLSSFFLCAGASAAPSPYSLSSCQLVFGVNNTEGQIIGIEPIAGSAFQADLTVSSCLNHVLEFEDTTINYFNPDTLTRREVPMPKSPDNACYDTGISIGAELKLQAIHFSGVGYGDKDLGCFIGYVNKDIITGETRPMIICGNQYSSALSRPDFQEYVCNKIMPNQYGLDQAICMKNMETAAYQLLHIRELAPVHAPGTNSTSKPVRP